MNLKPMNEYVFVKIPKEKKETKSGIILANTVDRSKSKDKAIVIEDSTSTLNEGDEILIDKYTSTKVDEDEDNDYYVVAFSDIYGVIENGK